MIENINLKDYPQASGVYKIIWFGAVIYVGSSNDLYKRMSHHRGYIKQGSKDGHKKGFYLFLQNNPFTIDFELTKNYRQREQELINYYEPIYNQNAAFTGLSIEDYKKQWYDLHKDERKQHDKQYHKQYDNQKCNYNGELLTLSALAKRFARQGIKHPTQEAKKYLIEEKEFHIV